MKFILTHVTVVYWMSFYLQNFVNPLIWNIDHMDAVLDSTRFIRKGEGFADSFCNFWRVYLKVFRASVYV